MSIALQRGVGGRGGIGGRRRAAGCFPIYDPSPALIAPAEGPRFVQPAAAADERLDSDTSSSSIGRNSDGEGVEEGEVQSTYKGPLETMDALEETLPIRRGISNFYCGKSKSFTTLADAVSASSVKDIAKPENPYTRKRKNLFALSSTMRDRARSHDNLLKSMEGGTGFAKRPANSSRSTFTITASTSSSGSNSSGSEEEHEPVRRLPPLHPRSKPAAAAAAQSGSSPDEKLPSSVRSRSLSLVDLRGLPTTGASD